MDLPINAAIACTDGPCGHSTAIILKPVSDQVTHVVVREPRLLDTEQEVEELVVNPANNRITHIVLREGHLWGRQDVTIPTKDMASVRGVTWTEAYPSRRG